MKNKQLKPFFLDFTESEIELIQNEMGEILRSGQLILGKHTQAFEFEFARYVGSKYAITLNTATSALEVLCVLKGSRGKKIAVPSNTNFASVASIIRSGGTPIFMDMTLDYFSPNLEILRATNEKYGLDGVMWVHIGGIIAPDFIDVVEYCRAHKIFLIEDAAHAHGSWMNGFSAGTFADGGAFSFFPTKVMTTMEGGIITTNSEEEAMLVRSFRNQGKRYSEYGGAHYDLGSSWRMSEIGAFMGLVQLAKLDSMVRTRSEAVKIISDRMDKLSLTYCSTSHMDQASQYKFIIKLPSEKRHDDTKKQLAEYGVICGGGVYEVPCHLQPVFANIKTSRNELLTTEEWCPRHICPPITSNTTVEDALQIADAIEKVIF